jgi:uncharacterized membrane protein YhaH (DUF805 family)
VGEFSTIDFFDPRGRVNRRGFMIVAAVLMGAQAGLYGALAAAGDSVQSGLTYAANAVLFWMAIAALSKRLHDLGMSAWRLVAAIAGMAVWCFGLSFSLVIGFGEDGFLPGGTGMIAAVTGTILPVAILVLWIHFARGEAGANRFGPAPGPSGFAPGPGKAAAAGLVSGLPAG